MSAAVQTSKALPLAQSIDHYIDSFKGQPEFEICGKIAIANEILIAERECTLPHEIPPHGAKGTFPEISDTWYTKLFRILFRRCPRKEVAARLATVAFVVFNYDRCLEHFLQIGLETHYGLSPSEAADEVAKVDIIHAYGSLGPLSGFNNQVAVEFGKDALAHELLELSANIRTFSESEAEGNQDLDNIRKLVRRARKIVFLGFAYLDLNLEMLFPYDGPSPAYSPEKRLILGTSFGFSDTDCALIRSELYARAKVISDHISLFNLKCGALFNANTRSLLA